MLVNEMKRTNSFVFYSNSTRTDASSFNVPLSPKLSKTQGEQISGSGAENRRGAQTKGREIESRSRATSKAEIKFGEIFMNACA
jgi:hypothetical protein